MNQAQRSFELRLHKNQPTRLPAAPGTGIECLEGIVWVTGGGLIGDCYLAPGQILYLEGKTPCLVEAIGAAQAKALVKMERCLFAAQRSGFSVLLDRVRQKAGKW